MRYIDNEVDRFSELPDDIRIGIISRLSFQEAIATSVLSTSWRRLQTRFFSLNFVFKPHKSYPERWDYKKQLQVKSEIFDYISRVNHAMDSYKGHDMHVSNSFRANMPLGKYLNKWLEFALSRKVEIIDLRLSPVEMINLCRLSSWCVTFYFDDHFFSNEIITRASKQSLLSVKELSLSLIHLDYRDVEVMLSNFVFLERLLIDNPGIMMTPMSKNLRVVGHRKLTHLKISDDLAKSIEIRDLINLVSLKIDKFPCELDLFLDSVPNLLRVKIKFGQRHMMHFVNILNKMSSIHSQLLHLKLYVIPGWHCIKCEGFTFSKLINLKHMELKVTMGHERSNTHQLFPLIAACPSLEKLDVKFSWSCSPKYANRRRIFRNRVKRRKPILNLEKVRLSGYFGTTAELELAIYLINSAVVLQELIIKACDLTPDIRQRAISRASYLLRLVPPNVNLIIL